MSQTVIFPGAIAFDRENENMPAILDLKNLEKTFVGRNDVRVDAVRDFSLSVQENEFVSLVGPSGCGKSTLLRIIAGLLPCDSGKVIYRGNDVTKPDKRLGMVFQNYSLLPWKTVIDNIALGLEFGGMKLSARRAIALDFLRLIHMERFAQSRPYELSGGMQQRVAIARALANDPDVILMDEPFGALDAYTRIILQRELLQIWERKRKTILFVTHSVDEAVYLADRIVVIKAGRLEREIPVNFPRPRARDDPRYGQATAAVLELLWQGSGEIWSGEGDL